MKKIADIINTIRNFYLAHRNIMNYAIRAVLLFVSLIIIRSHIGYNTLLTNFWIILLIALLGAFAPYKYFLLVILVYVAVQMFSLSLAVGLVVTIILAIMYLLFYRYSPEYSAVLILTPILFMIKLELVIPLLLAIMAPAITAITVLFGTVFYYLINYVDINATALNSAANLDELAKGQMLLEGVFSDYKFLYMIVAMVGAFMLVHFLKKISVNYSSEIAIASGTGFFVIITLTAELIFGTVTAQTLLSLVLGGLGSGIIVYLINMINHPLDYARTELIEFEDEEYQYYVRAVPKASFEKEIVNVKKINKRKKS